MKTGHTKLYIKKKHRSMIVDSLLRSLFCKTFFVFLVFLLHFPSFFFIKNLAQAGVLAAQLGHLQLQALARLLALTQALNLRGLDNKEK